MTLIQKQEDQIMWRQLFNRQIELLKDRVCSEYTTDLKRLGITADYMPDFREVNEILKKATGWTFVPSEELVAGEKMFRLLANRCYPGSTFIRGPAQLDYSPVPDKFHDIFGHGPMLMNPIFADYLQLYGEKGLQALHSGHLEYFSRLYFYTVEFGLIKNPEGLRIYGGGIVSSKSEVVYSLESPLPRRLPFDPLTLMQTPVPASGLQPIYFVINSFDQLFGMMRGDLNVYYEKLAALSDHAPISMHQATI